MSNCIKLPVRIGYYLKKINLFRLFALEYSNELFFGLYNINKFNLMSYLRSKYNDALLKKTIDKINYDLKSHYFEKKLILLEKMSVIRDYKIKEIISILESIKDNRKTIFSGINYNEDRNNLKEFICDSKVIQNIYLNNHIIQILASSNTTHFIFDNKSITFLNIPEKRKWIIFNPSPQKTKNETYPKIQTWRNRKLEVSKQNNDHMKDSSKNKTKFIYKKNEINKLKDILEKVLNIGAVVFRNKNTRIIHSYGMTSKNIDNNEKCNIIKIECQRFYKSGYITQYHAYPISNIELGQDLKYMDGNSVVKFKNNLNKKIIHII